MLNREALERELKSYWKDEKMVAHCLKSSKYAEIDGWFVDVCRAKPTINSEMYYNDEYDAPSTAKESFINYNKRNAPDTFDTDRNKCYLRKQYWGQNGERLAAIECCRTWDEPSTDVLRELTSAEMDTINAVITEVQADYMKRLETYYNRYANKISTHGYWANR